MVGIALTAEAGAEPAAQRSNALTAIVPDSGERAPVILGNGITHVVFFATWCPPCLEEMPRLSDMQARWEDDGYRLVLLAVPKRQSSERLVAFRERREPPGTVMFDAGGEVSTALGIDSLPFHVVFAGAGEELFRAPTLRQGVEERIEAYLRSAR